MEESDDKSKLQKLGEYIRRKRKEKRLTLEEVADLTGITFGEVGRIERGERIRTSLPLLMRLLNELGDPCEGLRESGFIARCPKHSDNPDNGGTVR